MINIEKLEQLLHQYFTEFALETKIAAGELTIEVAAQYLFELCSNLRDLAEFKFEQLMDLCGVDYSYYGKNEWATQTTTATGFSRGVMAKQKNDYVDISWEKPRFAVVIHLLSLTHNQRLRIRCFALGEPPMVPSITKIWEAANWFEREAFDLFGIIFDGHPDLRRILTDYGFIGYPFRKDFPIIGTVEPRYDAAQGRVIYEPVSIEPRVLVPKVIRRDNRYEVINKPTAGEPKDGRNS